MNWKEWAMTLFGHKPTPDPSREVLDTTQKNLAGRLAKLKGVTRDEVLNEAYRRARALDEERSYRRGRP